MYECLINIGDEKDIELFKKTSLYEPEMDSILKDSIGKWLHFDVDYLSIFIFSSDYRELLESTLIVAIRKKRA